ncbi:MAG: L-aspartate oxidase [bacterium]|nr:MAG: L-aspartate oxidase [bacterium]KAF0149100.1 MAG: L-aspartate oxidase [bacterium]KAF0168408.1 MAG: L-aspartate oxidase [bacterium]TXT20375.1 MAG: L-aspartate oxidase [bacterium]
MPHHDVLIIGSGLSAATLALSLPESLRVAVATKKRAEDSSSFWAQGGIAAVMGRDDSFDEHVRDTLVAGAGLCDEAVVRHVVESAPAAVRWLIGQGAPFDMEGASYHLTREGGHSHRRVLHAADATGRAVQEILLSRMAARPNITLLRQHIAVDLITDRRLGRDGRAVHGAYVLDTASGRVETFQAGATVLATGGAGKAFLYTTNPDTATGDGVAMAWRAGCRVANLEFIQFHPTCLYHPHAKSFLITEAMRGEGAILRLPDGSRFMSEHDERGELAPRDVVARAIDFEMKKRGLDCVYLDITHKPAKFIVGHFPTIHARCLELGIDITREWIPVAPAAHYTCGGVRVDRHGRTDAERLYAIGETACTGLHGANRLASNSLLECLVYGRAAAAHIAELPSRPAEALPDWDESRVTDADEEIVIAHNWHELRRFMWDYVGIVRTTKRLERAAHRLRLLNEEISEYYSNFRVSNDLVELRNLVLTADLIVRCARARHESRGLHSSRDYPDLLPEARDTLLSPG